MQPRPSRELSSARFGRLERISWRRRVGVAVARTAQAISTGLVAGREEQELEVQQRLAVTDPAAGQATDDVVGYRILTAVLANVVARPEGETGPGPVVPGPSDHVRDHQCRTSVTPR